MRVLPIVRATSLTLPCVRVSSAESSARRRSSSSESGRDGDGDDGMGASRVVGTTATVPPHPIWGGLLVTDGSSAFYSTPVSCSGLGAGAFGSAAVST